MKVEVVMMKAGKRTVNGYVYSENALKAAVKECQKRVKTGAMFGWSDTANVRTQPNLGNLSHRITRLRYDKRKKAMVGEIEVLNTKEGRRAWELIKSGAVGPCPLGEGKLTKAGRVLNYKFTTVGMSPIDQCDPGMSFKVIEGDDKA